MALILALALVLSSGGHGTPTVFAQHEKLALQRVRANAAQVARFGKVELTLDLTATYDNPFDPEDVEVSAVFTSPQGKASHVEGFLWQDYTRKRVDGREERLDPVGAPVWKVRFAPDTVGVWRYRVTVTDRSGSVQSAPGRLTVTPGSDPGFLGRSRRNPTVFAFAGEKPFFAVGENMCWAGSGGSYEFDTWLAKLGKQGGNWIRIWMNNALTTLEKMPEAQTQETPAFGYHGLGAYSLDHAWRLDAMLDAAERNNVYVMLCFGTYGEFTTGGFFNEGQWPANPYNAANGGPCAKPEDFWTNVEARKRYRQRLRYILARYGYRTHLHSWEFWNEANAPADWVAEMARYVKGTGEFAGKPADPFGHLLTTTYGNDAIWKIPEIDFTQTHSYGTGNIADFAPVVHNDALQHAAYGKPHLMGEFGIDWRDTDRKYDPQGNGINLHNSLWAAACSGDAGGAMIWWWDNYVDPLNLYPEFAPLQRFAASVPWTAGVWKPLTFDPPHRDAGAETFSDLTITPTMGWGKSAVSAFTITPQGVADSASFPQFLYSPNKADLRTTPTLKVRLRQPGRFLVKIATVSDSSRIRILLDGKLAKELALSAVPPKDPSVPPEYAKTEFKAEYGIYQAEFHKEYGVDVPAGEHTITLENEEGDWASLDELTLTGYRSSRYVEVNLYGMAEGKNAILWAQNGAHNWKNAYEHHPVRTLRGVLTALHGLPEGMYTISWWDTERGVVVKQERAHCVGGALPLTLPDLETDVAASIRGDESERGN